MLISHFAALFAFILLYLTLVTTEDKQQNNAFSLSELEQDDIPVSTSQHGGHLVRKKRVIGGLIAGAAAFSGIVSIVGIVMGRKDAEKAAERYEESMKFQLEQICHAICVDEWSAWSACTKQCGGGSRKRTRQHQMPGKCNELDNFECRHSTEQIANCNEGCPNGGAPSKAGCTCQLGWLGTCCTREAVCDYPGKPRHGLVQGTWPAKYRALITFMCDSGYVLEGDETMSCKPDETWQGSVPKCQRITCNMPRQNDHVTILNPQDTYVFQEDVIYMCDEGYTLQGHNQRTCKAFEGTQGRWSLFDPRCSAVKCGDPGMPERGERNGTDFSYNAVVSYGCLSGYKLVGSRELKCMASAQWLGKFPSCQVVDCIPPFEPKNGIMLARKFIFGSLVTFECDAGYNLNGSPSMVCEAVEGEGQWNTTEPTCTASLCGDPGIPDNGAKDGSVYYYPHNVTYSCFAGYRLQGAETISCQPNREWTAPTPVCQACVINTYMDDENDPGLCKPCPAHSHTVTEASTSLEQCTCDVGYTGPPGGPCTEIRCPKLEAPTNGNISECTTLLGSTCTFQCTDGFSLDRGSSMRTCQENAEWDGSLTSCSACPINTFKSDIRSCLPCPLHSHTDGGAQMKEGCVCDIGYHGPPGGPCIDIDECTPNDGQGECDDLCENTPGKYKCSCSIPGYIIDPDNKHTCIVDKTCRNLTEVDAPENGGLVCHWYKEENSQQCGVRCNQGYEFPSRINDYESCGSTTGYIWTHKTEDIEATFVPCVEEFFPDYRVEANSYYFVRACKDLTLNETREVMETFANTLNENGICQKRNTKVCEVKDMGIICGQTSVRRRKRDITGLELPEEEEVNSVDLTFNVKAFQVKENTKDCSQICTFLRIPTSHCAKLCYPAYKRFLKAAVEYAKRQLERLYEERMEAVRFQAAERVFEPGLRFDNEANDFKSLATSDVIVGCKPGMKGQDVTCVPCNAGSYYSQSDNECLPCPEGHYQPLAAQEMCVPCPMGTQSKHHGATFCQVCDDHHFGDHCYKTCDTCIHGNCDPRSGDCICTSGWEGEQCNIDTPGCRDGGCYPGVECIDVSAPGTGFSCGSCPQDLTGDGQICVLMDSSTTSQEQRIRNIHITS